MKKKRGKQYGGWQQTEKMKERKGIRGICMARHVQGRER